MWLSTRNLVVLAVALAVVGLVIAAVGVGRAIPKKPSPATTSSLPAAATPLAASRAPAITTPKPAPAEAASPALNASGRPTGETLAAQPCAWLRNSLLPDGRRRVTGVANPDALRQLGESPGTVSTSVQAGETIPGAVCDWIRPFRFGIQADAEGDERLIVDPSYRLVATGGTPCRHRASVHMLTGPGDFALFGVDPTGAVTELIRSRDYFLRMSRMRRFSGCAVHMVGDEYQLRIAFTRPAGLQGLLLLTGAGPFPGGLITASPAQRTPDWMARVWNAAQQGHWRAYMAWFRTIDPGRPPVADGSTLP